MSSMSAVTVRGGFAALLATVVVAASTLDVRAQSTASGQPLVINPKTQNQKPADATRPQSKPAARPASGPQAGAPPQPRNERPRSAGQGRIDDKTTTGTAPARKEVPQFDPPKLGRIPMEGGSFGFSSQTHMKSDRFPDGSRLPGPEHTRASDPSYFGLSLTVPTHDKMFSPFPRRPD